MAVTGHMYQDFQRKADERLREFILLKSDYWVQHVTGTRTPDGRITYKVQFVPSGFARRFRMLAHFRCLDRDDD